MKRIKLNFVLPAFPTRPGGGHKIMYEYANRLAKKGYDVMIYHAMTIPGERAIPPSWIRKRVRECLGAIFYQGAPQWFKFFDKVKFACIGTICDDHIRPADIVVSTQWIVAYEVCKLSDNRGRKVNLIQGYETWIGEQSPKGLDLLHASYKLPMLHIVIADYLADIVKKVSGKMPYVIYNSVDTNVFNITIPLNQRNPHSLAMMYSDLSLKGSEYGLLALKKCKELLPDISVRLFGVGKPPKNLPIWMNYTQCPKKLANLYNEAAIFFTPSLKEGWGLPATEAMHCGCALVCTKVEGHLVFAKEGLTALLTEPKDYEAQAQAIVSLMQDPKARMEMAQRGCDFVQQFSWDKALEQMEQLFASLLAKR